MRHLIDFCDMTDDEWWELYESFTDIIEHTGKFSRALSGKILGSLFYEPSTRTNLSFTAAMQRLGGSVLGFTDPGASSVSKGENLKDTITMVSGYADMIVMRNPREGAATAASLYSSVPVINAGDGGHMHPTQTLADLSTVMRLRGSLDDLHIGLCGDLKNGRTVHSLIKAFLRRKNISFYLISPRELCVPDYIRKMLLRSGTRFYEITGLEAAIPQLDVLYMTRIQKERFIDPLEYERLKNVYVLNRTKLARGKKSLMVLHPLPRVDEIAQDVDDDPRAKYMEQARYGMFIRMALLLRLAELPREGSRGILQGLSPGGAACPNPRCITRAEIYLPALEKNDGETALCAYCDSEMVN